MNTSIFYNVVDLTDLQVYKEYPEAVIDFMMLKQIIHSNIYICFFSLFQKDSWLLFHSTEARDVPASGLVVLAERSAEPTTFSVVTVLHGFTVVASTLHLRN